MSTPIVSVTEGRVTVTANDTEANIRASAEFAEPVDEKAAPEAEIEEKAEKTAEMPVDERNPDGTFKAKSEKPAENAKNDLGGDPRKSFQAKINLATAKQREAERRASELEAELQTLRAPKPAAPAVSTPQPTPAAPAPARASYLEEVGRYSSLPDAPKLDDFVAANLEDPYASYQAAMAIFVADQRLAEREQKAEATKRQQARESHTRTAIDLAEQAHPGFREQLHADQRIYPPAVLELLADETEQDPQTSAELMHHLVTHPDDAERLASMTHPIAAAREIGRLQARLSSASSGPETPVSQTNAKPLIKPVRPSIMAHDAAAPDDLPFGPRYIEAMNEKERKAATR